MNEHKERIAKRLARMGAGSRRDIEQMILNGHVHVNGEKLEHPAFLVSIKDHIMIDNAPITQYQKTKLWKYHKPAGLITTHKDDQGRKTVFDQLPKSLPRLVSIGRLDINSEGLLLLTNDGELEHLLEHPKTGWKRCYRVRVYGYLSEKKLSMLGKGMIIDGIHYQPIEVELEPSTGLNTWINLTLKEGKNREIRKILTKLDLKISKLVRTHYGPFSLEKLGKNMVEEISEEEVYQACHAIYPKLEKPYQKKASFKENQDLPLISNLHQKHLKSNLLLRKILHSQIQNIKKIERPMISTQHQEHLKLNPLLRKILHSQIQNIKKIELPMISTQHQEHLKLNPLLRKILHSQIQNIKKIELPMISTQHQEHLKLNPLLRKILHSQIQNIKKNRTSNDINRAPETSQTKPSFRKNTSFSNPKYQKNRTSNDINRAPETSQTKPSFRKNTSFSNPKYQKNRTSNDINRAPETSQTKPSFRKNTSFSNPKYQKNRTSNDINRAPGASQTKPSFRKNTSFSNPKYQKIELPMISTEHQKHLKLNPLLGKILHSQNPKYQKNRTSNDINRAPENISN